MKTRIEYEVLVEFVEKIHMGGKKYISLTYAKGDVFGASRGMSRFKERLRHGYVRIVG